MSVTIIIIFLLLSLLLILLLCEVRRSSGEEKCDQCALHFIRDAKNNNGGDTVVVEYVKTSPL